MNEQNITELIDNRLSPEVREILATAGLLASDLGFNLYLVGGMVRDLLLGRENLDLDLVTEGDAVTLAYKMEETVGGKVTVHPRFRTATVAFDNRSIDFVTARSETYSRPGALPVISPDKIASDLARRDFTVNSMAVNLSPAKYGRLIDPYNGQHDLEQKVIRILHPRSFIDDATRMWRAVRYEQRLGFTIEPETLDLLKKNLDMLETISRDRIRHELEHVLSEKYPEKAIKRAGELGMLEKIHPLLRYDDRIAVQFSESRERYHPEKVPVEVYLALLVYRMESEPISEIVSGIHVRKKQSQVLSEISTLKEKAGIIDDYPLQPSAVYLNLEGLSPETLTAAMIAEESRAVKDNISLYLDELRHVRISLTGADLRQMGFTSGPRVKLVLDHLLEAKLDGEVTDRQDEIERIKEFME